MFEVAELGRKISKQKYEAMLPKLRSELLEAHLALKKTKSSVCIIISGADGAGKGEVVQRLNEWLDPRGVDTHAFWTLSDEEKKRPYWWRFWRALPSRGRVGIFFGSWYTKPILKRVSGKVKNSEWDVQLDRIAFFEKMLAADGVLILKFWYHLSKKAQRRQLKNMEKDPKTHWRVFPSDWKNLRLYDKFIKVSERTIRHTDMEHAPWHLVEAVDRRYRELTTGQIILQALQEKLQWGASAPHLPKTAATTALDQKKEPVSILDHVDLSQRLTDAEYKKQLDQYQGRLARLTWKAYKKGISCVMAFEGWDAAGKGSAIRRVTGAIDPRLYRIVPVAAPTDEERARHYLWRFWRYLPRAGMITLFDRSWYGRVLVERVEGFAKEEEWQRAYHEINDFEEQLVDHSIVMTKFWIHISKDEQLRRFKEREKVAFKNYKITDEDWRNRKKWEDYRVAVNDMVAHTSTGAAPWTLVAGNDKKFARIQILKTIHDSLKKAL